MAEQNLRVQQLLKQQETGAQFAILAIRSLILVSGGSVTLTEHQRKQAIKRRDKGEETLAEIGRSPSREPLFSLCGPIINCDMI